MKKDSSGEKKQNSTKHHISARIAHRATRKQNRKQHTFHLAFHISPASSQTKLWKIICFFRRQHYFIRWARSTRLYYVTSTPRPPEGCPRRTTSNLWTETESKRAVVWLLERVFRDQDPKRNPSGAVRRGGAAREREMQPRGVIQSRPAAMR